MNNIRLFDNLMLKVHNVRQKYTFLISEQLAAGTQGHSRSVGYLQKQETNLDEMDPVLWHTSWSLNLETNKNN